MDTAYNKYVGTSPDCWGIEDINWNTNPDDMHYSLDGTSKEQFRELYPDGLMLGKALIQDLDAAFNEHVNRPSDDFWSEEFGCTFKLASAIDRSARGLPVTPVVIKPNEYDIGTIFIAGGFHRYAIARCIGLKEIPVYANPLHVADIDKLVKVQWLDSAID